MTTIMVTGSTGNIGSKMLMALAGAKDVQVRACVRAGDKPVATRAPNIAPVAFDFDEPEGISAALRGVERAFLLLPNGEKWVGNGKRFVDLAKQAGVKHIVKLSSFGCDTEPGITWGREQRAVEKHIEASGLAWTFLRPNNFMENFINYYPPDQQGNIYLPWGKGAVSFIASDDIAAVGALVLTTAGHTGKAYTLTGPEALGVAQAAAIIAEASGRTIQYVDVPEEAAKKALLGYGLPPAWVDGMMELHAVDKAGYAAALTPTVKEILGRPPKSFHEFARENASKWKV